MSVVDPLVLLGLGVLTFAVAFAGIDWLCHKLTNAKSFDLPNERSMHTKPVPRGGGLPVVLVVLIFASAFLLITKSGFPADLAPMLLAAAFIASVSWADDLHHLSTSFRLAVHCIAASVLVFAYGWWGNVSIPLLGDVQLYWAGLPVTFLWVVGLTNAFNFMDGIDGIAGMQGALSALGWTIAGLLLDSPLLAVLGSILLAASVAFLLHNWNPARIFMGDIGSATLGFLFAALAVVPTPLGSHAPVAAVLLVWPFVFDAGLTFVVRLARRESVFKAHRSHIYQRLVLLGVSHSRVTLLYGAMATIGLVASVATISHPDLEGYPVAVVFLAALLLSLLPRLAQRLIHRTAGKAQLVSRMARTTRPN